MDYSKFHWWSDWNGDEVGYDDVPIVGLYALKDFPEINMYVNSETGEILDVWLEKEE